MGRLLAIIAGFVTIAAAAALYRLKHETRRVETDMHSIERAIEKAESDIAALKAERAWLGRPERIDELARRQGLGPIRPEQYGRLPATPASEATR
ncbi:MAG: cell division protein FtsL [Proteobacteria bacterium]|nr:cell division protein FtsL [Pseudomonadota bacterium]